VPTELLLAGGVILAIITLLPLLLHFTRYLGPQYSNAEKDTVYESGVSTPIGDTNHRFGIKFYLVAILFVLFDVEIIFIFAWAVNIRELGMFGLIEMFLFMGLLIAGLIYVYEKKALEWD
jgi:NADH-quinone oxidoreductase subunit A